MSAKQKFWIIIDKNNAPPYTGRAGTMFIYFQRAIAERDLKLLLEENSKREYKLKQAFVKYK